MYENAKMKKLLQYLTCLIWLISGCQSVTPATQSVNLDIGDGGFLSEEPCGPPCFWGITPDVTTEEEAIKTFQDHFDIRNCDQWPTPKSHQEISCNPIVIEFNLSGKVDHISYNSSQPLTVQDAIVKYGEPSAINILGRSKDNSGTTTSVTILLFFDNIHTVIGLPEQAGTNYNVTLATMIGGINYPGKDKWKVVRENTQPWHGYGVYQGPFWAGP